ncbi:MAG: flagellar basal-body rod protein FlgG [Phycisphaeraceae bacterium]
MAITALHSAATGLSALSRELDIISNNLANVNTTGFKTSRANFEDLLYQEVQQPGLETADGSQEPAGLYVGLGTRISNTQLDFTQGSPVSTGNQLDLMIDGQGFFRVSIPDAKGGTGYTRAGNFLRNVDGQMVLGNGTGSLLDPPITIDPQFTDVNIDQFGRVSGRNPDGTFTEIGQLEMALFVNPTGLSPIGGNLYVATEASGPEITGIANEGSFGRILQGQLESSNVDPVKELVSLIKTQRAFEMNSQSIQAADQALQVIGNLRRF